MGKKQRNPKPINYKTYDYRKIEVDTLMEKMAGLGVDRFIPDDIRGMIHEYVNNGTSFYTKHKVPEANRVFEYIFNNKTSIITTINLLYCGN